MKTKTILIPFKNNGEVYPDLGRPLSDWEFNAWAQVQYEHDLYRDAKKMAYKMAHGRQTV